MNTEPRLIVSARSIWQIIIIAVILASAALTPFHRRYIALKALVLSVKMRKIGFCAFLRFKFFSEYISLSRQLMVSRLRLSYLLFKRFFFHKVMAFKHNKDKNVNPQQIVASERNVNQPDKHEQIMHIRLIDKMRRENG